MSRYGQVDPINLLSHDLWLRILSTLRPILSEDRHELKTAVQSYGREQAWLRHLPLVCKMFSAVFKDNHCFSVALALCGTQRAEHKPCLLSWLDSNGRLVQMLIADCTTPLYLSTIDDTLPSTLRQLTTVVLDDCGTHHVEILAELTSLSSLSLGTERMCVDIDALLLLSTLRKLSLSSMGGQNFLCTELPGFLTSLCVHDLQRSYG